MAGPARPMEDSHLQILDPMTLLQPGTAAPDFSADASDGKRYQLKDLLAQSRVLLVFYPGNNTPG
jgi:peroxiredoxin